jgi:hypothetical protein
VLAEGNYFASVKSPNMDDPSGNLFIPVRESNCKAALGRTCKLNVLTDSGKFAGYNPRSALGEIGKYAKQIGSYVVAAAAPFKESTSNFGVGELASTIAQSVDAVAKEAKDPNQDASQENAQKADNEAPGGAIAPYAQTSAETEAPANEADAGFDVTQGAVQSTKVRSTATCQLRKRK